MMDFRKFTYNYCGTLSKEFVACHMASIYFGSNRYLAKLSLFQFFQAEN